MPRPLSEQLNNLIQPGRGAVERISTVYIKRKDGVEHFLSDYPVEISNQIYDSKINRIGGLKQTNTPATDRVEISVSNADRQFGALTASADKPLVMADVTVQRYFPLIGEHKIFYQGKLIAPKSSQTQTTFEIIPASTAAGFCIAVKTLSAKNGFINPDGDDAPEPPSGIDGGTIGGGSQHPDCFAGDMPFALSNGSHIPFETLYERRDEFIGKVKAVCFDELGRRVAGDIIAVRRAAAEEFVIAEFSDGEIHKVKKEHRYYTHLNTYQPIGDFGSYKAVSPDGELSTVLRITPVRREIYVYNCQTEFGNYVVGRKRVHNRKYEDQRVPGEIIVL